MSLLTLDTLTAEFDSTTTGAASHSLRQTSRVIALICPSYDLGTSSRILDSEDWNRSHSETLHTTSGYATNARRKAVGPGSGAAILELRRLTGLTWEQLARWFQVARRSLHFWASGKPLNAANEEQLYRTLSTIHRIDRGSASQNRTLLFKERDGQIPYDLLAAGKYDEVVQLVGPGPGRATRKLRPLSPESRRARKPRPPEELTSALQDRIHDEPGHAPRSRNRPQRDK